MTLNLFKSENKTENLTKIECLWFTHCRDGALVIHFKDNTQTTIESNEYDYYGVF